MSDMIEQMASTVPSFEEFLTKLRSRPASQMDPAYTRMRRLLAQIYSDLLQFCHRACRLFLPSGIYAFNSSLLRSWILEPWLILLAGRFSKAKLHLTLAWRPFDLYFSDMIEGFVSHSKLFRLEMQTSVNNQALDFFSEWEKGASHKEQAAAKEMIGNNYIYLHFNCQGRNIG
jgi:hypothetical protein